MSGISVFLLGGFAVTRDGAPVAGFAYDKVRALLAYLAVETNRPHRRDQLAALFWPEQPRSAALQSLSQALYQLRCAIGDREARPAFLLITPQTVQFNPASDFQLDALTLQTLATACAAHHHAQLHGCAECLERMHQAAALYPGSFLEGFSLPDCPDFDEWALIERERLQRTVLDVLRSLWIAHDRRREHAQALQYARQRLAIDPWQEEAHREVMQTLAACGERPAAMAQFEACRSVLAAELGVTPCAETVALYQRLCAAGSDVATARNAHSRPPLPLTPLVGRAQELALIDERLRDPGCHLLSLVGGGGSGKTHLALAAASQVADAFDDGVVWVPLGGVEATATLVPAIAQALGFAFAPQGDPRRQLQDYLRPRQLLLLLDNFEHLLAGASLVVELLSAAPEVKALVTSRARLNVLGEQVVTVEGLALPPATSLLSTANGKDVAEADAVVLFLLLARRVRSEFSPSAGDLAAVAQLCTAVDGMPLAIVLAAAWIDTLSPAAIAAQIAGSMQNAAEGGIDFLAADWADLPPRQRSMRVVLDQSWRLLTAAEQQVLARLSVLRGGFTYTAAQAVGNATLRQLRALVEKSWLRRVTDQRYELHELLRQYAAEELGAQPEAECAAHMRHCAFFAERMQRCASDLLGGQQLDALAELNAEIDNVLAAWGWALKQADGAELAKMLDGLCRFFDWQGRNQQGEEMCRLAVLQLRSTGGIKPTNVLAGLLAWQGHFCRVLGDIDTANVVLAEALTLLVEAAGPAAETRLLHAFCIHERARLVEGTDRVQARDLCQESLGLYRAAADHSGATHVLNTLGDLAYCLGEYQAGLAALEEALALGRKLGDRRLIAESLRRMGVIHATLGEISLATQLHQESNAICQDIGNRWGIAEGEAELAGVLCYSGRFGDAVACYLRAAELYTGLGARGGYAIAIHLLGWTYTNLGQYTEARRQTLCAEGIWRAEGERHGAALSALSLGENAMATGDFVEASVQLRASVDLFRSVQQPDEEAIALGNLAAVLHDQGQEGAARNCVQRALTIAQKIGAFAPVHFALEAYALMLADGGEPARGLELYEFTAQHPYVKQSCWHADCFGRRIDALAAHLPPAEIEAARAGALKGNVEMIVQAVLAELGESPPLI